MHSSTLANTYTLRHTLALAVTALFSLANLGAQTTPAPTPATTPPVTTSPAAGLGMIAEAMYEHDFSAGIKNTGNGELSIDRFGLGIKTSQNWGDNHLVGGLTYSFNHYDFTGIQAPFSSVNKIGASDYFTHDFDSQWGAFGYIGAIFAADSTTNFFDGGQVAASIGPVYKFSQDLSVAVGPMIYTRLEDTTTWSVFAEANWKFFPQWELHAYAGTSNGVTVAYDLFNDQQTVADATVEYNSRWFQLSSVAGGDRSVNETDVALKLGVRQIFWGNYFARGYVSMLLDREYQFHVNGQSANSADIEDALGLGLEVGAAF
jgi:hypothetical protein